MYVGQNDIADRVSTGQDVEVKTALATVSWQYFGILIIATNFASLASILANEEVAIFQDD